MFVYLSRTAKLVNESNKITVLQNLHHENARSMLDIAVTDHSVSTENPREEGLCKTGKELFSAYSRNIGCN